MLTKEYRIPMPFTVDEYQIGQLFMIAKHSHEQSQSGEGVEVIHNVPHEDSVHGSGQYTEKRIHLSSRLPYWLQSITPRIFYITEKSWNYYPYTETEYTCSFLPKFNIFIKTKYENNAGTTENCLGLTDEEVAARTVDLVDIVCDELQPKSYKETEDPKLFKSVKTERGPLGENWKDYCDPIMCSYKLVQTSFEVWGLQTRVEDYAQKAIRDVLLLGHRQAFAWIDEWYGMSVEDVREYEAKMHSETNEKIRQAQLGAQSTAGEDEVFANPGNDTKKEKPGRSDGEPDEEEDEDKKAKEADGLEPSVAANVKSWFSWS
jgi:hypothetical protein